MNGERVEMNAVIGGRIRERRTALGRMQRDVSTQTGLSIGYLSDVENGKHGISSTNLWAIARALDVTPDWFFRPLIDGKETG